jgi:hypothetical protein
MRTWILKDDVITKIKTDPELYGKVAKSIGVSVTTMPRLLSSKSAKLTQISALETIGKYLQMKQKDLLQQTELQAA